MMVKHIQVNPNAMRMQRLFLAFIFGMVTIIALAFAMQPHRAKSPQPFVGVAQPTLVTTPVPRPVYQPTLNHDVNHHQAMH